MLTTVEGVYQEGRIELLEQPPEVEEARVLVTFLPAGGGERQGPALTPDEAAELRWKLAAWEEDWNAPGMEAYDDL